jgi:hypothetical protein
VDHISLAPVPPLAVHRTSDVRHDELQAVRRRTAAGELVRMARGLYVDREGWSRLRPVEQHVLFVHAVADRIRDGQLVSHRSAAAVLGVPLLAEPPERVHLTSVGRNHGTTNATFVVHADLGPPDSGLVTTPEGLRLSGPERLATDLALGMPWADAVVALDDLLRRGVDRDTVRDAVRRRGPRGRTRGLRAVEFADPAADSPGESLTRVRIAEYGGPEPVLQHRFREAGQPDIVVDFWFPEEGVVVEFDGAVKYRDPTMLAGRSPAEVLLDEKLREDRLRAMPGVRWVVRLRWADLWDEAALRAKLRRAGLRLSH